MRLSSISKYSLIDFIGIILFKIVLDYSYVSFVSKIFEYEGFELYFNEIKYAQSWLVVIALFILLLRKKDHQVYLILLLAFVLLIVPSSTLFAFLDKPTPHHYLIVIPYAIMLFIISTKRIKLKTIAHSRTIAIVISVALTLLVLFHYISVVGLSNINFSLRKEYELRSSFGAASNSGIFGYLNSWVGGVFNIFLISVALLKKKYIWALIFIFIQIVIFGLSGHKIVLFSPILLLGFYFFDKFKHQSTILIYSIVLSVYSFLMYFFITDKILLPSIFIRRAFFVPSNLNYTYFEYFSSNDYLYWSNSIFKYFISYPYDRAPALVIGNYLGYPGMDANTGIFGSGYMHFGILGIIIYVLIVAIIINIAQQFRKLPKWFVNAITFNPILALFIGSDALTALLTHGTLVAILILYLYTSEKSYEKSP